MIMKRIMFISDHASPLAAPGSTDSGGQNVYVAELARALGEMGYEVDIFTRRDQAAGAEIVCWRPGIRVIHVLAGPPTFVPKEQLLPFMDEFAARVLQFMVREN